MHYPHPGIINASDIFTKEIKDAAHYCHIRERVNFIKFTHTVPAHFTAKIVLPYYSFMSLAMAGESAHLADFLSQKDPKSGDTSDTTDIPSCQRVPASHEYTCDGPCDLQIVSLPSLCQFSQQESSDVSQVRCYRIRRDHVTPSCDGINSIALPMKLIQLLHTLK